MGTHGSLHIPIQSNNSKEIIETLRKEYGNPDSNFHSDPTHNGYPSSMLIYDNRLISLYDNGFAVYGEIHEETEFVSSLIQAPVIGITNAGADIIDFCLARNGALVACGDFTDEWSSGDIDVPLLTNALKTLYKEQDIEALFDADSIEQFLTEFQALTNRPVFAYPQNAKLYTDYLNSVYEDKTLSVLEQVKPFLWDQYGDVLTRHGD